MPPNVEGVVPKPDTEDPKPPPVPLAPNPEVAPDGCPKVEVAFGVCPNAPAPVLPKAVDPKPVVVAAG